MKIATDGYRVYNAVTSGIDIYDANEVYSGHIALPIEPNGLCIYNDYILTATSGLGVLEIDIATHDYEPYLNNSGILDLNVIDICAAGDYVNVLTAGGVSIYKSNELIYTHDGVGFRSTCQLPNGDYYYTDDTAVYGNNASVRHVLSSGVVNDMVCFRGETAEYNTVCLATTHGAVVLKDTEDLTVIFRLLTR